MFSRLQSAAVLGVGAFIVDIETHIENGLPNFIMVGLPDSAVKESRERVSAAIKNSGFPFPPKKITVNLAPADIRKEGSAFDLPVAIGVLTALGLIQPQQLEGVIIAGELALDGTLRSIRGALSLAAEASRQGYSTIILPRANAGEAALVRNLSVLAVENLQEAVALLREEQHREPFVVDVEKVFSQQPHHHYDLSDVKGQENVKRAMEVAAAGGHNLIMVGSPGSGKTMVAKRLPGILPPLTLEEALETTKIHSVVGLLPDGVSLVTTRPFRAPHHTISDAALVGGGMGFVRPGEISLAHHGVLFLDELPEFARNVLEVLRQPLEDRWINISRSKMSVSYPANFMLICSMNPCPCGNFGNPQQQCSCSPPQIQRYMAKISGPLLDRIDLHIDVAPVKYQELASAAGGERSEAVRERVILARAVQKQRLHENPTIFKNADMGSKEIREFCRLDEKGEALMKTAMTRMGLSARAFDRILKVARTIADLAQSQSIQAQHVSEAIQYRSLDRQYWNA